MYFFFMIDFKNSSLYFPFKIFKKAIVFDGKTPPVPRQALGYTHYLPAYT